MAYGDLKKWLDSLRADVDRLGSESKEACDKAWDMIDLDRSVVTSWVRRVDQVGGRRSNYILTALRKEGYTDVWARLLDIHQGVG